jgi:hypothetical protein
MGSAEARRGQRKPRRCKPRLNDTIFIQDTQRRQTGLSRSCVAVCIAPDALVRVVDEPVGSLEFVEPGFDRAISVAPADPDTNPAIGFV